jgi:hypothetical protein
MSLRALHCGVHAPVQVTPYNADSLQRYLFWEQVPKPSTPHVILPACRRLLLLVSCVAYSKTLNMVAICSSETSRLLLITLCYNPEVRREHHI